MKRKASALGALLFVVGSAHAASYKPVPNGYVVELVPTISPSGVPYMRPTAVIPGASAGEVILDDLIRSPGPGTKVVDLVARQRIPWSSVARIAGRGIAVISAGMIVYDIWDSVRVKPTPGGAQFDSGQTKQDLACWKGYGTGYPSEAGCAGTPRAAAVMDAEHWLKIRNTPTKRYAFDSIVGSCEIPLAGQASVNCTFGYSSSSFNTTTNQWGPFSKELNQGISLVKKTSNVCPAVPNHPNPVYQVPGGPAGFDGKCPTMIYAPISTEDATTLFEQNAPKGEARNTVEELLKKGVDIEPKPAAEISGPARVTETPRSTTTTNPQGNSTTTTKQDIHNITYQGNTYTWNTTTITTNNDGSTVEEEKPEEVPPPADASIGAVPDLYDQKYPNGLGGVWADQSSALKQTPIFTFLAGLNPNIASGGCPVFTFPSGRVLGIAVGGSISPPCSVWAFLRVFFVCCALLAARRLIFGG